MPARWGLAAAAIVAGALVAASLLARSGNVGDQATPSPQPATLLVPLDDQELAPGRYVIDEPFPVRLSFQATTSLSTEYYTDAASQLNVAMGDGETSFEIVDNITADPCTPRLLDPPVGPTVDDLVAALTGMNGFAATSVVDITVDGYPGKEFTLIAPGDTCKSMLTWKTTTRQNGVGPGEIDEIRIVDVDGVRLLICVAYQQSTPDSVRATLREVADSVQLGR
jgi:hypothetical protein